MAFHDISLPDGLQYQSTAGAGFDTIIQQPASGHEYRIARQSQGRHRFRLVKALQTEAEAKAIKAFALGRRGALHSFRLKDFSDYTTAENGIDAPTDLDHTIGEGDGTETTFQLQKVYEGSGPNAYSRTITLPVTGTVVVSINSVNTTSFTVSGQGEVVLNSAPVLGATIKAGCEFDVPVRFERSFDQWAQMSAQAFQTWSLVDMGCIEVLSEVELPERWYAGGGRDWGTITQDVQIRLNDGAFHLFETAGAYSAFLPSVSRIPGGDRIFTLHNSSASTSTVQIRDDAGTAIGSAMTAGQTKFVGLARSTTTSSWVVY